VYDDCTTDFDRLPTSHPLFLVLTTLVEDNRDPAFLLGKFAVSFFCYLFICV
jgi:dual specificity MAP kinase phosphatase